MLLNQFKVVPYVVSAVINNGWCKNGDNWIRYGDYHTETSHTINPLANHEKIELNISVVEYKPPAQTGNCLSVKYFSTKTNEDLTIIYTLQVYSIFNKLFTLRFSNSILKS